MCVKESPLVHGAHSPEPGGSLSQSGAVHGDATMVSDGFRAFARSSTGMMYATSCAVLKWSRFQSSAVSAYVMLPRAYLCEVSVGVQ